MSLTTGSKPFDTLLGGGLRPQDRLLVYGPSYQGKEVMVAQCMKASIDADVPVLLILTNSTYEDAFGRLMEMGVPESSLGELLFIVDAFSMSVGAEGKRKGVAYVESPVDTNGMAEAINKLQATMVKKADQHILVFDSISTLILYTNPQATFRFLQVALGRARRAGATSLLLMDEGLHSDTDVQMFRHVCDGSIELRTEKDRKELRVQGLASVRNPGWVEYQATEASFTIVGSLSAGRIK